MPRLYLRRPGERVRRPESKTRVYVPRWIDPYFWVQGSSIEKMVLAELVRRGIFFEHTPQTNPLPWASWMFDNGQNPRKWEADFLFPQYRIWLEIQGSYFHSLPGQIETDALRFAFIESVGWKPVAWWEEDIRARLPELMDAIPEFYRVNRALNAKLMHGPLPFVEGGTGIDHLKGLRAALRARGRPPQFEPMRRVKKRRPK